MDFHIEVSTHPRSEDKIVTLYLGDTMIAAMSMGEWSRAIASPGVFERFP